MSRLPFLLPLALLGGCVIYDTHGKCPHCDNDWDSGDWWSDTGDTDGSGGDTDTTDDTGTTGDTDTTPDADVAFTLTPSVGEVGATFIASLTASSEFDLTTVQSLEFYGDVDVLATEARTSEILLSLSIPAAAAPGTADLLVLLPDDRVSFLPDALTIVSAGTADDGSGGTDTDSDPATGGSDSDSGGSASCP
jgi:hypothetical protein